MTHIREPLLSHRQPEPCATLFPSVSNENLTCCLVRLPIAQGRFHMFVVKTLGQATAISLMECCLQTSQLIILSSWSNVKWVLFQILKFRNRISRLMVTYESANS